MQRINWTNLYNTSVEQLDSQHQWMVELVNRLLTALSKKQPPATVVRNLMALVEYTKQHFADEEDLMRRSGFPDYRRHKEIHDRHLRLLADEIIRLNTGEPIDIDAFRGFLKTWLIDHILQEDKKIGAHIQEHAPHLAREKNSASPASQSSESHRG